MIVLSLFGSQAYPHRVAEEDLLFHDSPYNRLTIHNQVY
jgi:hypothetical protein